MEKLSKKLANSEKSRPVKRPLLKDLRRDKWLYIFLTPILLYFIIFKYVPMLGTVMAFQDYKFFTGFFGSKWVGLEHFRRLFTGRVSFCVFNSLSHMQSFFIPVYLP